MSASARGEDRHPAASGPGSLSPARDAAGIDVLAGTRGRFTLLDQARAQVLTCWCAELIPAAPDRPSAAETGAAEYADQMCSASPYLRAALIGAVDRLDDDARDRHGRPFPDCASAQRTESLHVLEAAEPGLFALVLDLVYEAYYSAPAGLSRPGTHLHLTSFGGRGAISEAP